MNMDIEALGFTQEELQDRVVNQICETVLSGMEYDPHEDCPVASRFEKVINARIEQQVNDTINALAEKHVLPNVAQYIEELTLQKTNEWGEKKGEPVTFVEYLVQRAQAYMQEKVDFDGKSKDEAGYSWRGKQTRITCLIHAHLHYAIESAMKKALSGATGEIAKGISETAKIQLNKIAAKMDIAVTTR